MSGVSCMGGWCVSRDRCPDYYRVSSVISERLCGDVEEPGQIERGMEGGMRSKVVLESGHGSAPRVLRGSAQAARQGRGEPVDRVGQVVESFYRCNCGYEYKLKLGKYGCPNCCGEGGPARVIE